MDTLIIGLAQSGKSTIFSALTRVFTQSGRGLSVGMTKVPDVRLEKLTSMYNPRRVVPAEVKYVDTPTIGDITKQGSGVSGEVINAIQGADALLHVVRYFDEEDLGDEAMTSSELAVATLDLELITIDIGILERRSLRIKDMLKAARNEERIRLNQEDESIKVFQNYLEEEKPIRDVALSESEKVMVSNYNLLTAIPMLLVFNISEDQAKNIEELELKLKKRFSQDNREVVALAGQIEMELAQLEGDDEKMLRKEYGIYETGSDRVAKASFRLLGLISFFTVGEDEVRAWTVNHNSLTTKAAGRIHSDIERGFIRAEVISYDDFLEAGNMNQAKKNGTFRTEGKDYSVKDGDIINFLFNI
jgi:GTP-binding protein YchF